MATHIMKMKLLLLFVLLLAATHSKADSWGFENGFEGWTVIDANNDGYTWTLTSEVPDKWAFYANMNLDWYHTGSNAVVSGSYINGVGALTPDEYLVSPRITPAEGSEISFWAAATDASFSADHFGVAVSMASATKGSFTMIKEWTMTPSRDFTGGRQGAPRRVGVWHKYSVDLSTYAGQQIYVAIRHFNCYDQYILVVDNIELSRDPNDDENGNTVGIDDHSREPVADNRYYDLQGRWVNQPAKGLYIVNGKKVVKH